MSNERWYGPLGEVYTVNPGLPIPSGTGYGFIGYGNAEVVFSTLGEWRSYQDSQESFRQKSVVVKQQAGQNLRNQFETLLPGSSSRLAMVEFMVITETGDITFYGNRTAAQDFASSSNKVCAIGEIRDFQIIELPEAEVAARVAAL